MNSHWAEEQFIALLDKPLDPALLLGSFIPPRYFAASAFSNFEPDAQFPSQSEARSRLERFVARASKRAPAWVKRVFSPTSDSQGIYLDGGFGVGKTHLLAAAYHAFRGKKLFLTFQELMFFVGLTSLVRTAELLAEYQLIVLDEFELDDPANTRMAHSLLLRLFEERVMIVTSSNTPPGAAGEDKFSVQDFERELSDIASHFLRLRIEGEDHRLIDPRLSGPSERDGFHLEITLPRLLEILSDYHPIRFRQAMEQAGSLVICEVEPINDPNAALRFVYLIDKAYDNGVTVSLEWRGAVKPIHSIFDASILKGGDQKKFARCVSRLAGLGGYRGEDASWH